MRLSLYRAGVAPAVPHGERVVYDLERGVAAFGDATVDGPALVWEIGGDDAEPGAALLSRTFALEGSDWIVRCDRVDFPLGGIAHRHVHPGPGIRYLLRGEIEIETAAGSEFYGAGEAWFEIGPEPVLARASTREQTSFVRVLVLPGEWAGKRTIRYLEPGADATPKQAASILLEYPIGVT